MAVPANATNLTLESPPPAILDGTLAGGSTLAGTLLVGTLLAGTLMGGSAISGDLVSAPKEFQGLLSGGSAISGDLFAPQPTDFNGDLVGTSLIFGRLTGDDPPIIPATTVTSTFFTLGELAISATWNNTVTFNVIVTDWYNELGMGTAGQSASEPMLIAEFNTIPAVTEGDMIRAGDFDYLVREVQRDNTGIVRLRCSHA
jgi:hypothetical protein